MRVVYVYTDSVAKWDRSERRCAVPARAMNRTGRHQATLISRADFVAASGAAGCNQWRETCQAADIIVVQGGLSGQMLKAGQYWRARDKVVAVDIDHAEHLAHNGCGNPAGRGSEPSGAIGTGLKLVHAATLSSLRLAADCQEWAQVFHLPSYIEPDRYYYPSREPDGRVLIGWRGNESHLSAFTKSGVAEALRNVCCERPHVRVLLCTSDTRLVNAVNLPPKQVIWQPWTPFAEWPGLLASFDIGIAPLYGEYDQRRSWTQALEYMIQRIPWVASAGPVFQDLAEYGWLVNPQPKAWERVLLDMVDHLDEYRMEADRDAYLFALSQSIDENIDKVMNIYANITAWAAHNAGINGRVFSVSAG